MLRTATDVRALRLSWDQFRPVVRRSGEPWERPSRMAASEPIAVLTRGARESHERAHP